MIDAVNIQGMSAEYYEKKMTGSPEKFKIKKSQFLTFRGINRH